MMSRDVVVRINQELAETKVLSVYLNAEETDPAARRAWRIRLNGMLKALEEEMADASREERSAVRSAAAIIDQELERYDGLLPERGWVGFATPDRLWHAAPSAAPMPDLVRWKDGAHVAPYLRALKQSRPVLAVVSDRRRARMFVYLHGELREDEVLWSDAALADGSAAGSSKRAATRSGMRGEPRGDAARRSEEVSSQRLLRDVVQAVSEPLNTGHLLVVAGNPETTANLLRALPERVRERSIETPGVHMEATHAELKEAIDAAASALSTRLQRALVDEVLEGTRSAGRACLGREQTERALEAGAVDTLILSRAFSHAQPDVAEILVDRAFDQGATVEEISDVAGGELDREGGIGARLRFAG